MERALSFDEILSVSTISSLQNLYKTKGHSFASEDCLLDQLRFDWSEEILKLKREARASDEVKIPFLEVRIDEQMYRLWGVSHIYGKSQFKGEVEKIVRNGEVWLLEDNFREFLDTGGIELCDTAVNKLGDLFIHNLKGGLLAPAFLAFVLLTYIAPDKTNGALAAASNLPLEAHQTPLPCYVDLELRERHDLPDYSDVNQRSAYQQYLRNPIISKR